jgi:hypothetical protein
MNPVVTLAINAIVSLIKLQQDHTFDDLRDDIAVLKEKLMPVIPAKPDGTAWTDADLIAAKAAADINWQILKAITQ